MRACAEWPKTVDVVRLAGVALAVGCYYETPGPQHFTKIQVTTVPFDSIRNYAATLKFDSVIGAADAERMDFATGKIGTGDSAWIEPEEGAWALDSTDLADGRIIARIRTKSTVYAPLGYTPSKWTWWWVDKQHGVWRSLLLSDSLETRQPDSLKLDTHGNYTWHQSIARWKGSQWGTCCKTCCCGS